MPLPAGVRAVLVDIEGTTTPISFVYETLFPFARERLAETCRVAGENPPIEQAIRLLRDEHQAEVNEGSSDTPAFGNGAPYAAFLMDRDRKSTGLKAADHRFGCERPSEGHPRTAPIRYSQTRGDVATISTWTTYSPWVTQPDGARPSAFRSEI